LAIDTREHSTIKPVEDPALWSITVRVRILSIKSGVLGLVFVAHLKLILHLLFSPVKLERIATGLTALN